MDTAGCTTWRARSVRPPANATRITDRTGSVKMPPATNCVATADARNPKDVTATGLGAVVTGAPGVTVTGLAAGTGAPGRPLPGRPNSCQALTSKAMAATTRSAQATGSRTRRTLSHACAVSDGTSSPS